MYDEQETVRLYFGGVEVWLYWLHCGLKDTGFRTQEGQEIFNNVDYGCY